MVKPKRKLKKLGRRIRIRAQKIVGAKRLIRTGRLKNSIKYRLITMPQEGLYTLWLKVTATDDGFRYPFYYETGWDNPVGERRQRPYLSPAVQRVLKESKGLLKEAAVGELTTRRTRNEAKRIITGSTITITV